MLISVEGTSVMSILSYHHILIGREVYIVRQRCVDGCLSAVHHIGKILQLLGCGYVVVFSLFFLVLCPLVQEGYALTYVFTQILHLPVIVSCHTRVQMLWGAQDGPSDEVQPLTLLQLISR